MVTKLALFNHKGGVGKTTIVVNLARAFGQLGVTTLVADCDPQCNATAFYLDEPDLNMLLDESVDPENGGTVWSGIATHVRGRGDVRPVTAQEIDSHVYLMPGDVLLSSLEDRLSAAWKNSFSRDQSAIDLMSALYRCIEKTAREVSASLVLIDMGPSVGPLNRALLLGCDHYAVPVACDLFSLRALGTLGQTLSSWIRDWNTVIELAADLPDITLLPGKPAFIGYLTQHFNIYRGRSASAFEEWERRIAPRVMRDVIMQVRGIDADLAPEYKPHKIV